MNASCVYLCLDHAERITALPRAQWAAEIDALPTSCEHGCGRESCQAVNRQYLRDMYQRAQVLARTPKRGEPQAGSQPFAKTTRKQRT